MNEEEIYEKIKKQKIKKGIKEIIYGAGQIIPIIYILLTSYLITIFFMTYIANKYEGDFIKHIIENGLSGLINSYIAISLSLFAILTAIGVFSLLSYKSYMILKMKGYKPKQSYFQKLLNHKEKKKDGENKDKYRY